MNIKSFLEEQATASIVAVVNLFLKTWNEKDVNAFGNCFTSDAEFTDVVGQTAIGKEAVMKQHEFPFKVVLKDASLEMNDLLIRNLSDDLVLVSTKWKVEGSQTPDGRKLPVRNGVMQVVCKKEGADWKIRLVHNSDNNLLYETREKIFQ